MIDIKFRVWNDKSRQMWPVDKIAWDNKGRCHPINGESFLVYSDADKLMRSIGLCDIEGAEIYEGDIVEFQTFDAVEPVIFASPCFKTPNYNLDGYEVKIIGNIYESKRRKTKAIHLITEELRGEIATAIRVAIFSEDGLDGSEGERLLSELDALLNNCWAGKDEAVEP